MTYTKQGAEISISNRIFYIGQRVKISDHCIYKGLIGTVVEIHTGESRESETTDVELQVNFLPIMEEDISRLEAIFSKAYGEPKKIDELGLDYVLFDVSDVIVLD